MNIKIPYSLLKNYLKTRATPQKIAECLTLCGPSVDRIIKTKTDIVFDIEIITNRIDTASAFGLAREAVAILPQFGIQAELINNPYQLNGRVPKMTTKELPLKVQILDQSLVPRFTTIILNHLKVNPSPKNIQQLLLAAEIRPINNLVDITNYLTLSLGQPCHIFDYHKIKNHTLKLRASKKGETVTTLDHKTHSLPGNDIVIEDGSGRLVDLCGIMGGKNSEVDENTTAAILFVQTYNPLKIRQTSLATQERSLAAQICEKQPDPELVLPTLITGIKLLQQTAKAKVASPLIDIYPNPAKRKILTIPLAKIDQIAGINIPPKTTTAILKSLGFQPKIQNLKLTCSIPTWRLHDIAIAEDIIEEIIRIYGYFKLSDQFPSASIPKTDVDIKLYWEYQTKIILTHLGFTEIYHNSLISKSILEKSTLPLEHSIGLKNPLSQDYQYLRRSLIPSLLNTLSVNQGRLELPLKIFELSNIYLENFPQPEEKPILALATQGEDFLKTKGDLEALLHYLKISSLKFIPSKNNSTLFVKSKMAEI